MRILIISDIHANLAAFEAVLDHAAGQWDTIWCLGDLIGYGPKPNECVELLREYDHVSLSGNHDWAVLGKLDVTVFNHEAQEALLWTRATISEETHEYLDSLPSTLIREPFTLTHASPRQPIWEYILDIGTASANFAHFDTSFCLVGHTHVPICFSQAKESKNTVSITPIYDTPIVLNQKRSIFNPGSVGQPRDSDPRAAYAILDTDAMIWQYQRVDYPVKVTQEQMLEQGIPPRLAKRLEFGW